MGAGRPSKLTPGVQEQIVTAVRAGNYLDTAAAFAGVARQTVHAWMRRGARAKRATVFREFSDAIKRALAEAEMRDLEVIRKAAVGDSDHASQWQAAAWRLERKFFRKWGRKDRHEVTGKRGGPIEVLTLDQALTADTELEEWQRGHAGEPDSASASASGSP